jgi:WD40 repeat protein
MWDVATRERLGVGPLAVPDHSVDDVAYRPDGRLIAAGVTGSRNGAVVLWDAATREPWVAAPIPVAAGSVNGIKFSPDGRSIAASYILPFGVSGGGVVLLDVDLKSWQRRAGRIANRNFTRDEWRQYLPAEPYRPTFPELPISPELTSKDGER